MMLNLIILILDIFVNYQYIDYITYKEKFKIFVRFNDMIFIMRNSLMFEIRVFLLFKNNVNKITINQKLLYNADERIGNSDR